MSTQAGRASGESPTIRASRQACVPRFTGNSSPYRRTNDRHQPTRLELPDSLKCPMPDSPLWCDNDQAARLAELTADTSDPAKELPLRRDVRSLGILLGRVLVEQEGEAFFEVVERLRRLLIQHREQPSAGAAAEEFEAGLMAQAREI